MPDMNYQALGFYLNIFQWIAMGLMGVWVYLRTKDKDNAKALTELSNKLSMFIEASTEANAEQHTRIAVLEEVIKHVPTDEEIGRISNQVSSLQAQLSGVSGLLQRVEHQTNLIQNHLLNNK